MFARKLIFDFYVDINLLLYTWLSSSFLFNESYNVIFVLFCFLVKLNGLVVGDDDAHEGFT